MDKEKLIKAAWDYRKANRYEDNPYQTDIMDAFCYGADWLMAQPLADRLTDEEKEKIRALYNEYHAHVFHIEMDAIFGKDLFNDK